MTAFGERMIRAAKLDAELYEEVEHDKEALRQAVGVIILSGVAAGIGTFAQGGITGIVVGTASALTGWFIWTYVTFIIGTKLFPEPWTRLSFKEMLRTVGFAGSPGIIRVLGVIPDLTVFVFFVSLVWMLIATVVAARKALNYRSLGRTIIVCLIGWIIQIILITLFISAFSPETEDQILSV